MFNDVKLNITVTLIHSKEFIVRQQFTVRHRCNAICINVRPREGQR